MSPNHKKHKENVTNHRIIKVPTTSANEKILKASKKEKTLDIPKMIMTIECSSEKMRKDSEQCISKYLLKYYKPEIISIQ